MGFFWGFEISKPAALATYGDPGAPQSMRFLECDALKPRPVVAPDFVIAAILGFRSVSKIFNFIDIADAAFMVCFTVRPATVSDKKN